MKKIFFMLIIVGFLALLLVGYYYLVGSENWAGSTMLSFSIISILNKLTIFVFGFFGLLALLKHYFSKAKYFTDKMQDLHYVIAICITLTLFIPFKIIPNVSFNSFIWRYSIIGFVYLFGVASVCIKIFKLSKEVKFMNNSESNQKLKIGDTVQLKSGGPPMTIAGYDGREYFTCQWFAGDKVEKGYFPPDALQLVVVKPHKKGTASFKGKF